jgi:hypothetical protein
VILNVTGLQAWADPDDLEFYSVNAGATDYYVQSDATTGAPKVGDTSLSSLTFDYSQSDNPFLINGTAGDRAFVTQLITHLVAPGKGYQSLGKIFWPPSFDQTNGGTTTLMGAFTDVPQTQSTNLDWRRSEFEALRTAVNPNATAVTQNLTVSTLPGASTAGNYWSGISLIDKNNAVNTDLDLGKCVYGNPFPASWGVFGSAVEYFSVRYALGSATPIEEDALIFHEADVASFGAGPIHPSISPVRAPLINGSDAFTAHTGGTTTPTISWTAPALGTASAYDLLVEQLSVTGTATGAREVARIVTTQTSVVLPPGILTANNTYYLRIRSVAMPGIDLTASPNRLAFPRGQAVAMTATFTP